MPKNNCDRELSSQGQITKVCDALKKFLLEKNARYGDSALQPISIFSNLDSVQSITVRIDDKLSRISNSEKLRKNDLVDLTGYLILLLVSYGYNSFDEFID